MSDPTRSGSPNNAGTAETLIAAYTDGTLDAGGRRQLEAWVMADPANATVFTAQVCLHLQLTTLLNHAASARTVRQGSLIPEAFSGEHSRKLIDSARALRRPSSSKRRLLIIATAAMAIAAALLVTFVIGRATAAIPPTPALVAEVVPDGVVETGDGIRRPPTSGETLSIGTRVITGTTPGMTLGFADDATRLTLGAGSEVRQMDGPGKRFRVAAGTLHVSAAPQPADAPLVIGTAQAELTVVGTAFTVKADQLMTWLDVEHGTVRVGQHDSTLQLDAGPGQRVLAAGTMRVVPTDRGCGLLGTYFNSVDLRDPALVRLDPVIDFDWGDASPGPGVSNLRFSVRWTGEIDAEFAETYKFYLPSDDGARLWIDGKQVFNAWGIRKFIANDSYHGTYTFTADRRRVPIRLEFFEAQVFAAIRLSWESPSQPRQVIPAQRLFPLPP